MTEKERELLVGLAEILRGFFAVRNSELQWEIGGMLDELEIEDKKQEEYEEELKNMRE